MNNGGAFSEGIPPRGSTLIATPSENERATIQEGQVQGFRNSTTSLPVLPKNFSSGAAEYSEFMFVQARTIGVKG